MIFLASGMTDERSEIGTVMLLKDISESKSTRFHCDCEHVKDSEQLIPR